MQKQLRGIAAAVVAAMTLALGQPTLARGAHQGGRLGKMAADLGLTDAQKAQIKPILQSRRAQAKAVKDDAKLAPADRKSKIKAIRRHSMQQVGAILTPDQKQKLRAMRRNRQNANAAAPKAAPAF